MITQTVTNPVEISNIFLNTWKISHSYLSPTNKNDISSISYSLNPNKSVCPNCLPAKILQLLEDEISTHFCDIYQIPFSMGVCSSALETASHFCTEKSSKPDFRNYGPPCLLPNIKKIKKIEKLVHEQNY